MSPAKLSAALKIDSAATLPIITCGPVALPNGTRRNGEALTLATTVRLDRVDTRRVATSMNGVTLWLGIGAVGLAGFVLVDLASHAHGDGQHHHAHAHRHGHLIRTHHHGHGPNAGHEPPPDRSADARPCGGDEHHCCMERCPSDTAHFTLASRETRRLNELDTVAADSDVPVGASFMPEVATPPRAPPDEPTSQDTLPHLRTIVLLA